MFEIDLPNDSIIVSLHIRDDTMVVLACNIGRLSVYTVRRFVRSTGKLVKHLELPKFCHQHLNVICIDQFSNIIVCTIVEFAFGRKMGHTSFLRETNICKFY